MHKSILSRLAKLTAMATSGVVFQLGGCPLLDLFGGAGGEADLLSLLLSLLGGGGFAG